MILAAALSAPDVVFLTVDTLRADRLGCYGCEHPTSPNIDRLAGKSLVFENAVCEVPLTSPSFGSMLSSRFPRMTGTTRNGLRMPDSVPLVTEAFKAAGYETFCVQSNWSLKGDLCGLDRGFDTYDDRFTTKRWYVFKTERIADDVTDVALKLLKKRKRDKPLFCWIHYSDPHAPYKRHRKFHFGDKAYRRLTPEEKVRARYDSEVAFTDRHIGRLLKAIPPGAIIVFLADHGESLYEHDYLGHGRRIYQMGMHIPFMIRAPGIVPARTKAPVRGIDVGPTLLSLARLERLPGMLGLDLSAELPDAKRVRVVETYGGAVPGIPGVRQVMAASGPMRQGVLAQPWKLIIGGRTPELFNLGNDPAELSNLAPERPKEVARLVGLIEEWDKATEKAEEEQAELSEDDIEALETLGYLD